MDPEATPAVENDAQPINAHNPLSVDGAADASVDETADERPSKRAKTADEAAAADGDIQKSEQQGQDEPADGAQGDTTPKAQTDAAEEAAPTKVGAATSTPTKSAVGSQTNGNAASSPQVHHKARTGDVVYRMLVPHGAVGIVIGKGGCNVREIQSTSGARVQVGSKGLRWGSRKQQ